MDNKTSTDMVSVSTIATRLDIAKKTVINLIHAGELPAFRVGSMFRISEADFEDYLERIKTKPNVVKIEKK